jgi:hypothetical protein
MKDEVLESENDILASKSEFLPINASQPYQMTIDYQTASKTTGKNKFEIELAPKTSPYLKKRSQ